MKLNTKSVRIFTDKHLENMGSTVKMLYEDELLTDCTLCCKDGSIKAHKLVLASSSPYFRKVFLDHADDNAVFIMYGVTFDQLRDLVELIYKGCIDISSDRLSSVFDLAEELQVTGVLVEGPDTNYSNHAKDNRDTRYKGQKRVAVDFSEDDSPSASKNSRCSTDKQVHSGSEKNAPSQEAAASNGLSNATSEPAKENDVGSVKVKQENCSNDKFVGHAVDEESKLSVWARKERKFKCELCPSSFKRASHLSRHQLVHTGERPFACDQCDKAFSRHDKLKHHVHRAHELDNLNEALPPDSLYTIGHVQILSPEQSMIEIPETIDTSEPEDIKNFSTPSTPSTTDDFIPPRKKGRGRPRKYPIIPPPTVKRPRGRPRIHPIVPHPAAKRPRGRPRIRPIVSIKPEGYNNAETEFGDVDYLGSPVEDKDGLMIPDQSCNEDNIMEPLVEIKTEPQDKPIAEPTSSTSFFENIGLFENAAIGKIGECTISVAGNSNFSVNRTN